MATVLNRTNKAAPGEGPAARTTKRTRLPRPSPVTVNGIQISRSDIGRETQHHPAEKPTDAWMAAARALVVRELLLQEARRLSLAPEPLADGEDRRETDEEALVRQLVDREVTIPEADESACRRIYEQRSQSFRSEDLFAVRHILVPASLGDAPARSEAKKLAETLIAMLIRDPGSFAALASAHSACPSKEHGGALGQISRGQTVPEFEEALATAPVGSVIQHPVETRYGYHVVAVDQKLVGERLPFEIVHAKIASWLTERARATAIRQYIAMLAGRATITGIELEASSSPLVQ